MTTRPGGAADPLQALSSAGFERVGPSLSAKRVDRSREVAETSQSAYQLEVGPSLLKPSISVGHSPLTHETSFVLMGMGVGHINIAGT